MNQSDTITSINRATQKTCMGCRKFGENFKRCAKCKETYYCSRDCQVKEWPKHQQICDTLRVDNKLTRELHEQFMTSDVGNSIVWRTLKILLDRESSIAESDANRLIPGHMLVAAIPIASKFRDAVQKQTGAVLDPSTYMGRIKFIEKPFDSEPGRFVIKYDYNIKKGVTVCVEVAQKGLIDSLDTPIINKFAPNLANHITNPDDFVILIPNGLNCIFYIGSPNGGQFIVCNATQK